MTPQPAAELGLEDLVAEVRHRVGAALSARLQARDGQGQPLLTVEDRRALAADLARAELGRLARDQLAAGQRPTSPHAEEQILRTVLDGLFGLAGLQPLLDDPTIEDIAINGADVVWVRRAGGGWTQGAPVAASDAELVEMVRTVAARVGVEERRLDRGSPRLSIQLPDGSRLFAVIAVSDRPSITVRRHRYQRVTLTDLIRVGTVSPELAEFLGAAVRARLNIVISGQTQAGKTTLVRALAAEIPDTERIVTVEDSFELGLGRDGLHHNVVALQAREANVEGEGEVSVAEQVRWTLRMSPDRVIVGEVRGPEVVPMLLVMSAGNDGSMCTLHASSSDGVFTKIAAYAAQAEGLALEAANLLTASAVHLVVHLTVTADGVRVVSSVREVTGADGIIVSSNEVWRPGPDGVAVPGAPLRPGTAAQLAAVSRYRNRWPA
ncbi:MULTISPECIES: ATPase, T2SS/T4P/T4SS family [unclassified Frankia]|uniref:CpaF family protein n=1 Tax=unclassified Frankia TaxID=2632575 RepID=UPI0027DD5B86|nr:MULTISPECIES: ATPase, T2SS/T4P/T4SS family [unclassified Frankia]